MRLVLHVKMNHQRKSDHPEDRHKTKQQQLHSNGQSRQHYDWRSRRFNSQIHRKTSGFHGPVTLPSCTRAITRTSPVTSPGAT